MEKVVSGRWRAASESSSLASYDDFAQVVAGEEEFYGGVILKQFFQAAVVEELRGLAFGARGQQDGAGIVNAIGVSRDGVDLLLGMEEEIGRASCRERV